MTDSPAITMNDGSVAVETIEMVDVRCPNNQCNKVVGHYITVIVPSLNDGEPIEKTWLEIGELEGYSFHGRCKKCHTEFHFAATAKAHDKILERHERRKVNID